MRACVSYHDRVRDRLIRMFGDGGSSDGEGVDAASLGCKKGAMRPGGAASGVEMVRTLESCCATLAHDYDLTRREAEVLTLLARRKTTLASMARELTLSVNMIKSHMLHVHQKLDVRSHEELFALIESYGRDGYESARGVNDRGRCLWWGVYVGNTSTV